MILTYLLTYVCIALQLYSSKHAFNERLLALRDKKIQMVDEINSLVKELKQIQSILGPQISKPLPSVPVIHPCETPEKYLCHILYTVK